MKKMNTGVWAGIILCFISLLLIIQSLQFPYTSALGLGPGFLPIWISSIMLILSLFYIYESKVGENSSEESFPKGKALKNILFILAAVILFLVMISMLGFILSSIIFLFILLYRSYKWYTGLGISVGVSFFLFWLFGSVLSVPLPINGFGW